MCRVLRVRIGNCNYSRFCNILRSRRWRRCDPRHVYVLRDHIHSDTVANVDAYGKSHQHADRDAHVDPDQDTDADADSNADAEQHSDQYTHADSNRECNANPALRPEPAVRLQKIWSCIPPIRSRRRSESRLAPLALAKRRSDNDHRLG